jgi:hypothetical protein
MRRIEGIAMQRRLVREPEARDYVGGVSHGTWHDWRRRGLVAAIKVGRSAFYDMRDLDVLIERLKRGEAETAK